MSKFESISAPSVFIGSKLSYPLVNVGILSLVAVKMKARKRVLAVTLALANFVD